jgi:hypothetical protein
MNRNDILYEVLSSSFADNNVPFARKIAQDILFEKEIEASEREQESLRKQQEFYEGAKAVDDQRVDAERNTRNAQIRQEFDSRIADIKQRDKGIQDARKKLQEYEKEVQQRREDAKKQVQQAGGRAKVLQPNISPPSFDVNLQKPAQSFTSIPVDSKRINLAGESMGALSELSKLKADLMQVERKTRRRAAPVATSTGYTTLQSAETETTEKPQTITPELELASSIAEAQNIHRTDASRIQKFQAEDARERGIASLELHKEGNDIARYNALVGAKRVELDANRLQVEVMRLDAQQKQYNDNLYMQLSQQFPYGNHADIMYRHMKGQDVTQKELAEVENYLVLRHELDAKRMVNTFGVAWSQVEGNVADRAFRATDAAVGRILQSNDAASREKLALRSARASEMGLALKVRTGLGEERRQAAMHPLAMDRMRTQTDAIDRQEDRADSYLDLQKDRFELEKDRFDLKAARAELEMDFARNREAHLQSTRPLELQMKNLALRAAGIDVEGAEVDLAWQKMMKTENAADIARTLSALDVAESEAKLLLANLQANKEMGMQPLEQRLAAANIASVISGIEMDKAQFEQKVFTDSAGLLIGLENAKTQRMYAANETHKLAEKDMAQSGHLNLLALTGGKAPSVRLKPENIQDNIEKKLTKLNGRYKDKMGEVHHTDLASIQKFAVYNDQVVVRGVKQKFFGSNVPGYTTEPFKNIAQKFIAASAGDTDAADELESYGLINGYVGYEDGSGLFLEPVEDGAMFLVAQETRFAVEKAMEMSQQEGNVGMQARNVLGVSPTFSDSAKSAVVQNPAIGVGPLNQLADQLIKNIMSGVGSTSE